MARLFVTFSIITVILIFRTDSISAEITRIQRDKSPLDIEIVGVDNSLINYYYLGWDKDLEVERHGVFYRNRIDNRYLNIILLRVANDEYYWSNMSEVTIDKIKTRKYFRDKAISIIFASPGVNAGFDSVAGEPSYLLFKADSQDCTYVRCVSAFGRHGGTTVPYIISGFYCVPEGEALTRAQAKKIPENGLIFENERR